MHGFHTRDHERDAALLRLAERCRQEGKFMPKMETLARHYGFSRDRMKVILKRLRQEERLIAECVRKEGMRGARLLIIEVRQ